MNLLFIAGLEHSGSTLLSHLLAQHPRVLNLGEVASFFSPTHMRHYIKKWGAYPDAKLCSCGESWENCSFWGEVSHLNGLASSTDLAGKYAELVGYIDQEYGPDTTVIDSSKSLAALKTALRVFAQRGSNRGLLSVALAVKDVRSFAGSIARKTGERSLLRTLRTFNWWLGKNRSILSQLKHLSLPVDIVLYERLCADPGLCVDELLARFDLSLSGTLSVSHNRSHIAMGNKDFAMRNRDRIKYDKRWILEDQLGEVYFLHRSARRFNKSLYGECLNPVNLRADKST